MSDVIKTTLNLIYEVNLEYSVDSYTKQELKDIVTQVAESTEMNGFELYCVSHCNFNPKQFSKSRRNDHILKFNFALEISGILWGKVDDVQMNTAVPLVDDVSVKAVYFETFEAHKIKARKRIEAVSDSPVDKAIAEAVNLLETQQGKKGFYRALQKALKAVKNLDPSLVEIRLNSKAEILIKAAEALRGRVVQKSTGKERNTIVEFKSPTKPASQEEIKTAAKCAALDDIKASLEPQEFGALVA